MLEIKDQWVAGWLLANGAKLLRVEKGNTWLSSWVFAEQDGLGELLEEWETGAPIMNCRQYAEGCREARRALRNAA